MTKPVPFGRSASYKDLCDLPDDEIGELINGDLWVSPRPIPRHSHVLATLLYELGPPFQHGRGGPGGWHFLSEVELHLADDVLVPDIAGWRTKRKLGLLARAHITHSPDWVCEILSKSTEEIDRTLKLAIYQRERVGYVWFVDPVKRKVEVLKLAAGVYVPVLTLKGDAIAAVEPFDAVPFPLNRIWPER